MKDLLVMGVSHRTATVDVRERFAVPEGAIPETVGQVRALPGVEEAFLLSTCNRVELYTAVDQMEVAREALSAYMSRMSGTDVGRLDGQIYTHQQVEAVRHLFRVAASLDSMVVGEPQILGQVKTAYETCRTAGSTGSVLQRAVERAFRVAKKVRTETGIGRSSVSISSVAVDLARQIFGDLRGCTGLLVGAGEMGELAARSLVEAGVGTLLVANRSLDRAVKLAEALGGHPRGLDEMDKLLTSADVVITSTGARNYLVDVRRVKRVLKARKYRPLFFIDIAVPRNVDPALNDLDSVFAYDVDDLSGIAAENLATRQREAQEAERMVSEDAQAFVTALTTVNAAKPTIVELRQKAQAIKAAELDRARKHLGALTPEQQKSVERLCDGVINKLLHGVQVGLKQSAAQGERAEVDELVRRLFLLDS